LEATDLFFEWDLGLTVFTGGLGEEQLIRNNNSAGKIFLIILIIYFFEFTIYRICPGATGRSGLKTEGLNIILFKKYNILQVQFPV